MYLHGHSASPRPAARMGPANRLLRQQLVTCGMSLQAWAGLCVVMQRYGTNPCGEVWFSTLH